MKTLELPPYINVVSYLQARVASGDVLHGSPRRDLAELRAQPTNHLHVRDSGLLANPEALLCATDNPAVAIFYATVHKVAREAALHRASGVRSLTGGYEFFASEATKRLVAARRETRRLGAVYCIPRTLLKYDGQSIEWNTADTIPSPFSIAVSDIHLPFDLEALAPPDSDPTIHAYFERYGIPPETQIVDLMP